MEPVSTRNSPSQRRAGSAGLTTETVTCVAPMCDIIRHKERAYYSNRSYAAHGACLVEEGEELFEFVASGLAAVFANFKALGVLDGFAALFAVPGDEVGAVAV